MNDAEPRRVLGRSDARALLLFKHARDGQLWERLPGWITALRGVLQESGLNAIEQLMRYIVEMEKGPPTQELQHLLEREVGRDTVESIMTWAQQLREEGRKEGRQEGRQEGAARLLTELVRERFGQVPHAVAHAIEQASYAQLSAWTHRLFVATSPEDVVGQT